MAKSDWQKTGAILSGFIHLKYVDLSTIFQMVDHFSPTELARTIDAPQYLIDQIERETGNGS